MRIFALLLLSCLSAFGQQLLNPYVFAATSTLNTGLVAYWKLDEASGDRTDTFGGLVLTNHSAGSTTGKISNCTTFTSGSSHYMQGGDVLDATTDFTIGFWGYKTTSPAATMTFIQKGSGAFSEYEIYHRSTTQKMAVVTNNGTVVDETTVGVLATGAWFAVMCWFDSGSGTLYISVNDTAAASGSASVANGSNTLNFGCEGNGAGGFLNGRMDEVAFWSRVLTAGERTEWYNSTNGKTCCPF
jgi:hypothetical protein